MTWLYTVLGGFEKTRIREYEGFDGNPESEE
jgi:hypothetical protein